MKDFENENQSLKKNLEEERTKNSKLKAYLKRAREIHLIDIDDNGIPKADISQITGFWNEAKKMI